LGWSYLEGGKESQGVKKGVERGSEKIWISRRIHGDERDLEKTDIGIHEQSNGFLRGSRTQEGKKISKKPPKGEKHAEKQKEIQKKKDICKTPGKGKKERQEKASKTGIKLLPGGGNSATLSLRVMREERTPHNERGKKRSDLQKLQREYNSRFLSLLCRVLEIWIKLTKRVLLRTKKVRMFSHGGLAKPLGEEKKVVAPGDKKGVKIQVSRIKKRQIWEENS